MRRIALLTLLLAANPILLADARNPARPIEERFLAPCCWRESVALHRSPEAEEMRAEIQKLIQAGKTEAQIVDLFVERYGERILREPRGGPSLWLIVVPVVVLLTGTLLVARYIAHARRLPQVTPAAGLPPLPEIDDNGV